jgi:hypothetical protein
VFPAFQNIDWKMEAVCFSEIFIILYQVIGSGPGFKEGEWVLAMVSQ